ncbi:MAG: peptidoglycan DD-metalloendopeptidase family protein [Deferribacterales bacterium]
MTYPYILLSQDVRVEPVVRLKGKPLLFSINAPFAKKAMELQGDSKAINDWFDGMISSGGAEWALGPYLEDRESILSVYPQMRGEARYFHLGIDICAPAGMPVYTPLDGVVEESGYEEGEGNYGGYAVVRYDLADCEPFYMMYGHMNRSSLPSAGEALKAGEQVALIGDLHENGGWNHHTHIQIITEKGKSEGYFFKGYCSAEKLKEVELLCPNPMPIITAGFQNL